MNNSATRLVYWLAIIFALALSACGGDSGGSDTACSSGVVGLCGRLNPTTSAQLQLSLTDASGNAVSTVTPTQPGTLLAVVRDTNGTALPNIAVTFSTSDTTGSFAPTAGSALTDANGVALVGLRAGTKAGGFAVTARASVRGTEVTGTVGYAVTFPQLSLSPVSIMPESLSAGGNANVSVTVLNGATTYQPSVLVSFRSPCVLAGKAVIGAARSSDGSAVPTVGGMATATYTDKGCGTADTITASADLGGVVITSIGRITVLPAGVGSMRFVGVASPSGESFIAPTTTNIALKGTGGVLRQEFAPLTFQVFDTTGNAIAGKTVDFLFSDSMATSTVGGLTLNPASAVSGVDGTVKTLVSAGTIPTSVRVIASIRGSSPPISTLSNILVTSTGVPDQKHFSLTGLTGNCEGFDVNQLCTPIRATLGDHFGNPVADGTAVNFTSEGGIIGASCVTKFGYCDVDLISSNPRPTNGRVTVLAYALGEETFEDANGNNVYDSGDALTDMSPDIFRDDTEDGIWTPGEPCVGPNMPNAAGVRACRTPGDGQYNGVLRTPQTPSAQTLYVSAQLVTIFSGSHAVITFNPAALTCPVGTSADVMVTVTDQNTNIMPAGTSIDFSALFATGSTAVVPSSQKVANIVPILGSQSTAPTYKATIPCQVGKGQLVVLVTSPTTGTKTSASLSIN